MLRQYPVSEKVTESSGPFRAAGDADVKLSAYQIVPPSQLGVQTTDDVKLHLEFTGHPAASMAATNRGGQ